MKLHFSKYSATGNDFILIDNRERSYKPADAKLWEKLCRRRESIGADGVLFLEYSDQADFRMIYLNADGKEAEMCGNGARAICHFASQKLKLDGKSNYRFQTKNAFYTASLNKNIVRLEMSEQSEFNAISIEDLFPAEKSMYLNTGVPHAVFLSQDIDRINLKTVGKEICHDNRFQKGTNVNFIEVLSEKKLKIRTYERGVEDETLSCGTGVVAAAIASTQFFSWKSKIDIESRGGKLSVEFSETDNKIFLIGEVDEVYKAHCFI